MAKRESFSRSQGFSLVELMVAVFFTLVLMAGLASVFKASLSTLYTSGEKLSSARRNRMSVDMLADDINAAMMYLVDITIAPQSEVVPTNPPFYVLPNMPIAGAGASDPQTGDELFFMMDQALPFEGTVRTASVRTANQQVNEIPGGPPPPQTFTIDCRTDSYARMIKVGQHLGFKDDWSPNKVIDVGEPSGGIVTVTLGEDPTSQITGAEGSKVAQSFAHIPGSGVVITQKHQVVRYRIEMLQLDPQNANGIPCLVRDQGTYSPGGFVADQPQQIITENVSGFKVYLSVDGGLLWAGLGQNATGFTAGWDQGIRAQLDAQLAASGRPGFQTTRGDEFWFRSSPTLVRVDVSTRTATQRAEYVNAPNTPDDVAYKNLTQSLVFVPRHAGLKMD